MLNCNHVVKKYISTTAVNDLTLTLEPGRIYALLGPNGSGKTTFMKMVAGLVKPTSGDLTWRGEPIGVSSKAQIAYMPTEPYFYSYMTGRDAGNYYKDFFPDFDEDKYLFLLKRMELDPFQKITKMSSGMMAKLKIALNLSRDASLIMLDEPLNGIDLLAREAIIDTIIENFSPEKIFVLSSHLVEELEKNIDPAVFIKNGRVELAGDAEELRETHHKSIVELYKTIYGSSQEAPLS